MSNALRYRKSDDPAQTYMTPEYALGPIRADLGGSIDLDPCTIAENPTGAARFFTADEDGLAQPWDATRIFVNPPYGKAREPWVHRCVEAAATGARVVLLIPAATDTRIWQLAAESATAIVFVKGRLKFGVLRPNRRQLAASHASTVFGWNTDLTATAMLRRPLDGVCGVTREPAAASGLGSTVAALFVEKDGAYFGLPGVDPWDEQRDARLYAGPWSVVAHPPCARWGQLANVNHARYGTPIGEDGGCFEAALDAVRTFGGVLEHPANSIAWRTFDLPKATRGAWTTTLNDPGYATEVSQVVYGHGARKRTWLYAVGCSWPLDWTDHPGEYVVGAGINTGECQGRRLPDALASRTPEPFRDVLLGMARSVRLEVAA